MESLLNKSAIVVETATDLSSWLVTSDPFFMAAVTVIDSMLVVDGEGRLHPVT